MAASIQSSTRGFGKALLICAVLAILLLLQAMAYAKDGGYKPYPRTIFCSSPTLFDETLKIMKSRGEADSVELFNMFLASGLCVQSPIPIPFLGEKVVRDYGDLSEWNFGTGNVIIEGILVGGDVDDKVYVWADDSFHSDMMVYPEIGG